MIVEIEHSVNRGIHKDVTEFAMNIQRLIDLQELKALYLLYLEYQAPESTIGAITNE